MSTWALLMDNNEIIPIEAVLDYFGVITKDEAIEVIILYFTARVTRYAGVGYAEPVLVPPKIHRSQTYPGSGELWEAPLVKVEDFCGVAAHQNEKVCNCWYSVDWASNPIERMCGKSDPHRMRSAPT